MHRTKAAPAVCWCTSASLFMLCLVVLFSMEWLTYNAAAGVCLSVPALEVELTSLHALVGCCCPHTLSACSTSAAPPRPSPAREQKEIATLLAVLSEVAGSFGVGSASSRDVIWLYGGCVAQSRAQAGTLWRLGCGCYGSLMAMPEGGEQKSVGTSCCVHRG